MRCLLLVSILACGGKTSPSQHKMCDSPEPGQAMTEAQCSCRAGRIVLSNGKAVELHCEADEHELGAAKMGDREGWCCK